MNISDNRNIKIGYISHHNPYDRRTWSGTPYYIIQALEQHCGHVEYLGTLNTPLTFIGRVSNGIFGLVRRLYDYSHSVLIARSYARQIQNRLSGKSIDVLIAQCASEIAYLSTEIPIILTTDATFPLMCDYYPYFSNIFEWSKKESVEVERRALKNASRVIYPSEWAAKSAQRDYGLEESKINVINYGANIDRVPDKKTVLNRSHNIDKCRLLFLGVEWERKGGGIAFETLLELDLMGIDAELTVVGCIPPARFKNPRVSVIPFLNKNNLPDRNKLDELLFHSDFLLLPTRAEALGIVYSEASAFGLPILTTNTGGISSVVIDGKNGFLFPLNAGGHEYAMCIANLHIDPKRYNELVVSSRDLFETKLNWDNWGKAVKELIIEVVANSK